jgi:hypothetical protein
MVSKLHKNAVNMYKTGLLITFCLSLNVSSFAQKDSNFLMGEWKIVKTISSDPTVPLTAREKNEYRGKVVIFKPHSISISVGTVYRGCTGVHYSIKHVETAKYFADDPDYLKVIGYKDKTMDIVETSCDVPFSIIQIYNDGRINIGGDGYIYILVKVDKSEPVRTDAN